MKSGYSIVLAWLLTMAGCLFIHWSRGVPWYGMVAMFVVGYLISGIVMYLLSDISGGWVFVRTIIAWIPMFLSDRALEWATGVSVAKMVTYPRKKSVMHGHED